MKKYSIETPSPWAPEDAFEYMARFSNAQEWDPGVLGAEDLDHGPPRLGEHLWPRRWRARVALSRSNIGSLRSTGLCRVVLVAGNAAILFFDLIEVYGAPGGSKVVYEAAPAPRARALDAADVWLGFAPHRGPGGRRGPSPSPRAKAPMSTSPVVSAPVVWPASSISALDISSARPGFSRLGIGLRRRLEAWDEPPSMHGQVAG